jgi:hypothetical protein
MFRNHNLRPRKVFLVRATRVMGVDIDTTKGFHAGAPRRRFAARPGVGTVRWDGTITRMPREDGGG